MLFNAVSQGRPQQQAYSIVFTGCQTKHKATGIDHTRGNKRKRLDAGDSWYTASGLYIPRCNGK